jgi:hypothetical protein
VLNRPAMATKKTSKTTVAGSTLPTQADPVPAKGAPSPPIGFALAPKGQRRPGLMPTAQQVRDASDAASELTSSSKYTADFGNRVPSATIVAGALNLAKGWSDQLAAAETWLAYVKVQYESSWRGALQQTSALKPEFQLAVKHDASVSTRYPQMQDFLAVRAAAAARATVTKANKKKAAKKTT